ncbi:DCD (Development and Cell Death) domain protein [Abeliophyllum distichum]|uniref:DCD (Development and Cell Death) domain protein n=1 Tax=Abeliophyllum distichum TaxID=126358 RepID=A0ABD1TVV9_9LAMI
MENGNQSSFWQFSDNLRLEGSNLESLSLNDSIWSTNHSTKRPAEQRRNFDIRVGGGKVNNTSNSINPVDNSKSDFNSFNFGFSNDGWKAGLNGNNNSGYGSVGLNGEVNSFNSINSSFNSPVDDSKSDFNSFNFGFSNDGWKAGINSNSNNSGYGSVGLNGGFNKGIYPTPSLNFDSYSKIKNLNNVLANGKVNKVGRNEDEHGYVGNKIGKKNKNNKESNNNSNGENKSASDKRFKTLPPSESLPRNETVGGYIFVCNNDTMQENLKRQLFGLPPRYRDSVRAITPGLPLFLYNYSTHQLHGVFEAASFGGTNIDPTAWEDKKNPAESRFPAQVRVITRKVCEPLEEDSFRPILHHYDGPKFRLELNVPEAISLLDIFADDKTLSV